MVVATTVGTPSLCRDEVHPAIELDRVTRDIGQPPDSGGEAGAIDVVSTVGNQAHPHAMAGASTCPDYCVASEQEAAPIFNDFTVNVRSGLLASADGDGFSVPAVPVGPVGSVAAT